MVTATLGFIRNAREERGDRGQRIGLRLEPDELRMMAIALGLTGEDFPSQQRLPPGGNPTLWSRGIRDEPSTISFDGLRDRIEGPFVLRQSHEQQRLWLLLVGHWLKIPLGFSGVRGSRMKFRYSGWKAVSSVGAATIGWKKCPCQVPDAMLGSLTEQTRLLHCDESVPFGKDAGLDCVCSVFGSRPRDGVLLHEIRRRPQSPPLARGRTSPLWPSILRRPHKSPSSMRLIRRTRTSRGNSATHSSRGGWCWSI